MENQFHKEEDEFFKDFQSQPGKRLARSSLKMQIRSTVDVPVIDEIIGQRNLITSSFRARLALVARRKDARRRLLFFFFFHGFGTRKQSYRRTHTLMRKRGARNLLARRTAEEGGQRKDV